jgi:hypothetical protein
MVKGGTAPNHAAGEPSVAHDALIAGDYIDFANPGNSRFIEFLEMGHRNKDNAFIQSARDAITAWNAGRGEVIVETVTKTRLVGDCGASGENMTMQTASIEAIMNGDGGASPSVVPIPMDSITIIDDDFEKVGTGATQYLQSKDGTPNSTGSAVNDGGYATATFTIPATGNYKLAADVFAPSGSQDSFWLQVDNEGYFDWHTGTHADFEQTIVSQTSGQNDKTWMNLSAGTHTLHIKHREEEAAMRNLQFYPANGAPGSAAGSISVDVSDIVDLDGATLTANIIEYDDYSYQIKNLQLIVSEPVVVKGVKIYINGYYNPQHATYTFVDTIVTPENPELSPYSMLMLKDGGPSQDKLQFQFNYVIKQSDL